MYMIIRYLTDARFNAVVLSASGDQMRVVVEGRAETADFKYVDGYWTDENGARIEVESLVADGDTELSRFYTQTRPQVFKAGSVS
jgi:hypothetical protein